jgi:hypothetical protein
MSSPDLHSEMAHWLQDNLAKYLFHVNEEGLAEFVEKLMPHVSNIGVRVIHTLVSEVYPTRSTPTPYFDYANPTVTVDPDDDEVINYGGTK